ncbi:MAG TPA: spore germination protein GerW family protein [Actinomycetaceae bacterium]|nr:spore germination protein GerW family protein [Actinomycetaceae bacterium]
MASATDRAQVPVEIAGDALHVRRVFGEAYRDGDTLVIPVAKVFGGGGSGYGEGSMGADAAERDGSGGGGGFGVRAKPVGVYVVRDGRVQWQPALDLNRVILGGQLVGAVALVLLGRLIRRRRKR